MANLSYVIDTDTPPYASIHAMPSASDPTKLVDTAGTVIHLLISVDGLHLMNGGFFVVALSPDDTSAIEAACAAKARFELAAYQAMQVPAPVPGGPVSAPVSVSVS